jgi:hypothetical protein
MIMEEQPKNKAWMPKVRVGTASDKQMSRQRSLRQDSLRSDKESLLSEGSTIDTTTSFKPREINYSEIMSYYTPKWLAVIGFVASVFAAF